MNEYLGKVENGELATFLEDVQVSPDGRGVFVVVDLLGTGKEYAGLYKLVGETGETSYGILN